MSFAHVLRELRWLRSRLARLRRLTHTTAAIKVMLQRHVPVVGLPLRAIPSVCQIRQWASDLDCLEQIFVYDEYRLPFSLEPRVIVDAGANIGAASLYFAHKYPDAKIVALEPERSNFELLQKNCAAQPSITPIQAALWWRDEKVALADPDTDKWAFSVRHSSLDDSNITALTIDAIMCQANIKHIDLLKIDIEGAEREVFGMRPPEWLSQVSVIIIELHDRYKPGCSEAFYSALRGRHFNQEIRGENIFIELL